MREFTCRGKVVGAHTAGLLGCSQHDLQFNEMKQHRLAHMVVSHTSEKSRGARKAEKTFEKQPILLASISAVPVSSSTSCYPLAVLSGPVRTLQGGLAWLTTGRKREAHQQTNAKDPISIIAKEKKSYQPETAEKSSKSNPSDPFLVAKHLLSGAMSAVVSRTFVAPLERVRMELVLKQSSGSAISTAADVLRSEGVAGFWKGNAINILRTAPFKALNFYCFDTYRKILVQLVNDDGNFARFGAGALAGMTATIVCFPLDVVRTRLMAKGTAPRYGGAPLSTMVGILRHEGLPGLYSGALPAVIGMIPAGSIFYGVFDLLKHQHLQSCTEKSIDSSTDGVASQKHLGALYTLLFGAMAGVASELVVYPLEVIRRRMQMHSMAIAAAKAGAFRGSPAFAAAAAGTGIYRIVKTCKDIFKADGLSGFYSGMAPNLLQVLPSSSLSYYTYNTCKEALNIE